MGRRPCCAKEGLNRGAWSAREDKILTNYIKVHGEGKWRDLPQRAGTLFSLLSFFFFCFFNLIFIFFSLLFLCVCECVFFFKKKIGNGIVLGLCLLRM